MKIETFPVSGEVGLVQQIDLAIQEAALDNTPRETAFLEQVAQLEQLVQQHLAENQELMLEQAAFDLELTGIDLHIRSLHLAESTEDSEFKVDSLPILIIMSHFQIDSEQHENTLRQRFSSRELSTEPSDKSAEHLPEVAAAQRYTIVSQHELSPLDEMPNQAEGSLSVKNSIIEEVLKPLYEQLTLKRQQANEAYVKNRDRGEH